MFPSVFRLPTLNGVLFLKLISTVANWAPNAVLIEIGPKLNFFPISMVGPLMVPDALLLNFFSSRFKDIEE